MEHVLLAVPPAEAAELEELKATVEGTSQVVEARPFDGVVVAQILVPLTLATIPVLKAWLTARFDHRKSQTVVVRGMKFTGYSAEEVKELFESLDQQTELGGAADDGS